VLADQPSARVRPVALMFTARACHKRPRGTYRQSWKARRPWGWSVFAFRAVDA